MGHLFYFGEGVQQNYTNAFLWYSKAAEQNDPAAQYNLGELYRTGLGAQQSQTNAIFWYQKAADQRHKSASLFLARCYGKGRSVPQDSDKALALCLPFAKKGNAEGQYLVGLSYMYGKGFDQDFYEASRWFEQSLEKEYDQTYQYYAWLLATCQEEQYRDGEKAVRLAEKAMALFPNDWTSTSILAAAYAENGQFDLAVEAQNKAIELVEEEDKEDARARLKAYENHRPWRESYQ